MFKVVYLVLILGGGDYHDGSGVAITTIPQANMQQCQANLRQFDKKAVSIPNTDMAGMTARCVVGVK